MSYEIFYDQEKHIVRVRSDGPMTTLNLAEAVRKAIEIGQQHNCKRYLGDWREAATTEPIGRTFLFMDGLEDLGLDRGDRIAVVYERDPEVHEFAKMVAHNRGWHNLRYFQSLEKAEAWLHEEE